VLLAAGPLVAVLPPAPAAGSVPSAPPPTTPVHALTPIANAAVPRHIDA
jgi:hypothetical protein